jgi:hypothetical protein
MKQVYSLVQHEEMSATWKLVVGANLAKPENWMQ